ncbi:hypothetical protein QUF90_21855 [Desulfococcaceae bacterium HSG9]|nr:hypothetical protein [Desulfococcaceae bacterium HSG9]
MAKIGYIKAQLQESQSLEDIVRQIRQEHYFYKIGDSTTIATAIADRLVYNSEFLIKEGNSYREKKK